MNFTPNMGDMDRMIRGGVGAVLLLLALFGALTGTLGWIAGIVGVVFLATAAIRFCPAYTLFGIKTCKTS